MTDTVRAAPTDREPVGPRRRFVLVAPERLFAHRYGRTDSPLAASFEHALYGILAFTVGLGEFFYHGAAR